MSAPVSAVLEVNIISSNGNAGNWHQCGHTVVSAILQHLEFKHFLVRRPQWPTLMYSPALQCFIMMKINPIVKRKTRDILFLKGSLLCFLMKQFTEMLAPSYMHFKRDF